MPDDPDDHATAGLLHCTSCGRVAACSHGDVGRFIRSGWPNCCGEVMAYYRPADRPEPPQDDKSPPA